MSERMRRLRGEHQSPADDTNEDVDPEAETRTR
jgi:hypothetical protein